MLALQIRSFRDYIDLYLKNAENPFGEDGERSADQVVHDKVNNRWEVCVTPSSSGFQQVSFVNSIATTKVCQTVICATVFIYRQMK